MKSQFHGQGKLEYPDGSKYEGMFNQGAKSGRGTMLYGGDNSTEYIGDWKDDRVCRCVVASIDMREEY